MRYFPHTPEEIKEMLSVVKEESLEGLFSMIPGKCRMEKDFTIDGPYTEWRLNKEMDRLAEKTISSCSQNYLGAGRYFHYIPETISSLIGRSEFSTAYTPYQPEVSQGTLQAIYEYQTLITKLLGMDISNASLYDGASALAEALLMSVRIKKRKTIAISKLVHPLYREVVSTYLAPADCQIIELPYQKNGLTDIRTIGDIDDLGAVVIQSPNFFGCIENLEDVPKQIDGAKTIFIACFTEAIAFGLLKPPGDQGADIVCGEGQSLGIPLSFGGPGLGILTCRRDYLRSIPGRLVGKTEDKDGKTGFVLTLATREQHIRRGKATSNICTNSSLCALRALIYMTSVGGTGIKELALLNHDKAEYLKKGLEQKGVIVPFSSPTFNEFVVRFENGFEKKYKKLIQEKIVAGIPLSNFFQELKEHYLLCVTECKTRQEMDEFIEKVTK